MTTHDDRTTIDGSLGDIAVIVSIHHTYYVRISPTNIPFVTIDDATEPAYVVDVDGYTDDIGPHGHDGMVRAALNWAMDRYADDTESEWGHGPA